MTAGNWNIFNKKGSCINNSYTDCTGFKILGGYECFGMGTSIQTTVALPHDIV